MHNRTNNLINGCAETNIKMWKGGRADGRAGVCDDVRVSWFFEEK